jgi:hypothetical protein
MALVFLVYMKNFQKAAIASFVVTLVNFFMGSFHELLVRKTGGHVLSKYSVFLPLLSIFCLISFVLIKKVRNHHRLVSYLNFLFGVLCAWEVIRVLHDSFFQNLWQKDDTTVRLSECKNCYTPDIYLIIADEYSGYIELKDEFNFDNSAFLDSLKKREFYVVENSFSNYDQTYYSMASMFKMHYLDNLEKDSLSKKDINYCYSVINKNPVTSYLKEHGYQIKNYSIFPLDNQFTTTKQTFLLTGLSFITHETLISKIEADIGYHLIEKFHFKPAIEANIKTYNTTEENNKKLLGLLSTEIHNKSKNPRFVYTHLSMPHYPYYFDKNGNRYPIQESASLLTHKSRYIEYLQYCNTLFLTLIDSIQQHSLKPHIILFMSDHGFRMLPKEKRRYQFMTINAVFYPDKKYGEFYSGMSNVNQFRIMLNKIFKQRLPLMKDSTVVF